MAENKNLKLLTFFLTLFFFILFARLFWLQIIEGKKLRQLAEGNRIRRLLIQAPRGLILDRHGEVLALNEPLYLYQDKVIERDEALKIQERGLQADFKISLKRRYPAGETFAHLIGYLGEIAGEELAQKEQKLKGYFLGSLLGRSGVEEHYEELLRGQPGSELLEVDTQGKIVREMGRILPKPGKILTLAVDRKLQEAAASAFGKLPGNPKGAVIATNAATGEILTFYSSPSFDPNLFLKPDFDYLTRIIKDEENRPLLNRVISGIYPPGSTFKIVTAIAGLEEGKINANTKINDPGVITVGAFKFSNWYYTGYGRTEGEIALVRAIARSTDTFFYKVGEWVGIEKLNFWAEKFNLTKTHGIDLPGEVPGFMATPEWKQKVKNEPWYLGNTYHLSIGQGDLDLTPLGVALMTAAIANGGKICQPRVLKIGAENTPYQAGCREIGIKKEFLTLVKEGMIEACSAGGTGWPFFGFEPQVGCKTGTAETGDGKTTHAWFTVFAPADSQIVLTVLVEKGGEGSSVAGPIAKEILKEYFK